MSLSKGAYIHILNELKEKIRQARIRASYTVNTELLKLYWEIGYTILEQQKLEGWGAKVIKTLSADLKTEFPDFIGLSVRNLTYMRDFTEAYPLFGQGLFELQQDDFHDPTICSNLLQNCPGDITRYYLTN